MNDWTPAQIKELVGAEIKSERRLRDALRKEDQRRIDESITAIAKALELQAKEYERRLEDLNHAHAEARRVLHTYVSTTVYEKDREAFRELKSLVEVELAARASSSKGVILLFQILSGIAIAISTGAAILSYMKK